MKHPFQNRNPLILLGFSLFLICSHTANADEKTLESEGIDHFWMISPLLYEKQFNVRLPYNEVFNEAMAEDAVTDEDGLFSQQINETSFFVRFDFPEANPTQLEIEGAKKLWKEKASGLCQHHDFYTYETLERINIIHRNPYEMDIYLEDIALDFLTLHTPTYFGFVFCNNLIEKHSPEIPPDVQERFLKNDYSNVAFTENNGLWLLLMNEEFDRLEYLLSEVIQREKDEFKLDKIFSTFSRRSPDSLVKLQKWYQAKPESGFVYFALALQTHSLIALHRKENLYKFENAKTKEQVQKLFSTAHFANEKAIQLLPGFVLPHAMRLLLNKQGNRDLASNELNFRASNLLHPESILIHKHYYFGIASGLEKRKKYKKAYLKEFGKTHRDIIKPIDAMYKSSKLYRNSRFETSVKRLEASPPNFPFHEYQTNLAFSYELSNDYKNAIKHFENAANITPFTLVNFQGLYRNLLREKEYLGALKALNHLIAIDNNNPYYYNLKGDIFYDIGHYQKALEEYTSALNLAPDTALYMHNMRRTHYQLDESNPSGSPLLPEEKDNQGNNQNPE